MPNGFKENCPFCKIAHFQKPAHIVGYNIPLERNPKYMAFLDQNPYTRFHTLVIPRQHYETIWDMEDRELSDLIKYCKKVVVFLRRQTNQRVPFAFIYGLHVKHAHIHVIPYDPSFARQLNKFNELFRIDQKNGMADDIIEKFRMAK